MYAKRGAAFSSGFSLVEVMVAMVIGMLGIIVMMQMFSTFEAQKRTTTSGDDAISGGAVSLYGVQRNIQQSGWGITTPQIIGCSVSGLIVGGGALPLAPVTINPAAITGQDANTDTLLVVSGNGNGTVEGDNIESVPSTTSYAMHTAAAFLVGDRVVAVPQTRPVNCNLVLTTVTNVTSPNVTVGAAASFAPAPNDKLYNLGTAPTVRAYAVRNQNLTVCDYTVNNCGAVASNGDTTVWVPVANNVVSLRAQYGRDTTPAPMDAVVDVWDQASPATACEMIRASAVRLALIARSSQPEKTLDWPALTAHVTQKERVWTDRLWAGTDDAAHALSSVNAEAVAVTLPEPDPTWPTRWDFRYKVFQTTVPLRNVTILGARSEC